MRSFALLLLCSGTASASQPKAYLTTLDKTSLLAEAAVGPASGAVITVDESRSFQSMAGFGWTLTGGSALLLHRMSPPKRRALLEELFTGKGAGASYLRVSVGASDLDERVFSYDDLPPGEADPGLKRFSLAHDREHLIPMLKEILAVNPGVKVLGSPWSAPAWMKDNAVPIGGRLKPDCRAAYARYLVKWAEGYAKEGIKVDALTIQNEPLNPKNNPSMVMTPEEQRDFLKGQLGPAFAKAGLGVKLLLYDHNADRVDYPLTVLADPAAKKYAAGSAFHLYGGSIDDLSKVHDAHPDRDLYFTEQWVGAPGDFAGELSWHLDNLMVGAPRNWCRTVLEWNLASDPKQEPHTDQGGCDRCLGAVTLDKDAVERNPAYYIIAQAARFVPPGSVRVASDLPEGLPNVAYRRPDGGFALLVRNAGPLLRPVTVSQGGRSFSAVLPPGAAATFVW